MIYFDSETCGLHGMAVLIQWAEDDGSVNLHNVWQVPIADTLELIDQFCQSEVCGFNLAFDWFHLCKLYTTFSLFPDLSAIPEDHIDELAILEERARFTDICLKPKAAHDVMLHARKTQFQSLMDREDIKIRRVPTALAWQLAQELERRIKFDDIYFAKAKDPYAPRWKIYDIKRPDGTINPDFKDIKLKFKASSGLKNLYRHAFKIKEAIFTFRDIELDRKWWPFEYGFAPYALAVCPRYMDTRSWYSTIKEGQHKRKVRAWPAVIDQHILHWGYNGDARKYAGDDVVYTRRLHKEYFGGPPAGDDDSTLACMVAACRWKGYAVDLDEIRKLKDEAIKAIQTVPTAPRVAKRYVIDCMDETEKAAWISANNGSTKKVALEEVAKWCDDEGVIGGHPAAKRANEILNARKAIKEKELYEKILHAKRFHASFKVIGALSSRMSGADGLNPQGIHHGKHVRKAFTLADRTQRRIEYVVDGIAREILTEPMRLCGGDFKSFEVSLAAKVFDDPIMDADLRAGIKVHAVMGMNLFPGTTYEEVLASEGTKDGPDMYDIGKKGFFLKCYFGEAYTFNHKLGIAMDVSEGANTKFDKKYPRVKVFQDKVKYDFSALSQPGGLGTRIEWKEPAEYAESFLGFRRWFTLENQVIRALFELAQSPPPSFQGVKIKVIRRERIQTAGGAVSSALYGAAFGVQGANIRAAGNHFIQSPGAQITKATQRAVWDIQPAGISKWIVQPMNIHDEIMTPTRPGYEAQVERSAKSTVDRYKKQVPLLAIDWMTNISSWAAKKGEPIKDESSPVERLSLQPSA